MKYDKSEPTPLPAETPFAIEAAPASLREALADANKIIAMMRRHCSEDHPDCAYAALGVMQDAHRAALDASPSAAPLDEGRLRDAMQVHAHGAGIRRVTDHCRSNSCAAAIAAAYDAERQGER